jgi:predicted nucleic acid-binding protein
MRRRYWDSNCFIGWLDDEEDKAGACGTVIREAEAGNLRIVTSVLTLAEVLYLKRSSLPTREQAETIEQFFEHEWIILSNVDRDIAELARRVIWESGVKPKDAIHVASALDAEVEQFDTFDVDLIRRASGYPVKIDYPNLPESMF